MANIKVRLGRRDMKKWRFVMPRDLRRRDGRPATVLDRVKVWWWLRRVERIIRREMSKPGDLDARP